MATRPAYARTNEGRAGVDVKLVPRDAVTLDFTVNPDFSQVESDEPQVTVNQRFEVFFPEKRPFFLENSDFFAYAPDAVLLAARARPAVRRADDRQVRQVGDRRPRD